MTAQAQLNRAIPAAADSADAAAIVAGRVRRRKGRVRRVAHAIVPRTLRRRFAKIHERIHAEMHIATRA